MTRIVIAAPYPTPRAGLRAIMSEDASLEVVAAVDHVEALIEAVDDHAPDVALVELVDEPETWLADLDAAGETAILPPLVLILGTTRITATAMTIPRSSLLLRDVTAEEIRATTRAAALGLIVLDPRIADELDQQRAEQAPAERPTDHVALTAREREVIGAIARGLPNKAIASELGISEHTVKFHVGSIFQKLGVSSRAEALAVAARSGLIAL